MGCCAIAEAVEHLVLRKAFNAISGMPELSGLETYSRLQKYDDLVDFSSTVAARGGEGEASASGQRNIQAQVDNCKQQ